MAETSEDNAYYFDPETDRFPTLLSVLAAIPHIEDLPQTNVERLEINLRASGEATVRVWEARAEEPAGAYIPASQLQLDNG